MSELNLLGCPAVTLRCRYFGHSCWIWYCSTPGSCHSCRQHQRSTSSFRTLGWQGGSLPAAHSQKQMMLEPQQTRLQLGCVFAAVRLSVTLWETRSLHELGCTYWVCHFPRWLLVHMHLFGCVCLPMVRHCIYILVMTQIIHTDAATMQ